jgi:hypothetical protein
VTDRELLDDLIAKLTEMEEQLSMARLEAPEHSVLGSRIRHLSMLAIYVRAKLESVRQSADLQAKADDIPPRDSQSRK